MLNTESEKAQLGIYPNAAGRPMLPDLYDGSLSMAEPKHLIRCYLDCLNCSRYLACCYEYMC